MKYFKNIGVVGLATAMLTIGVEVNATTDTVNARNASVQNQYTKEEAKELLVQQLQNIILQLNKIAEERELAKAETELSQAKEPTTKSKKQKGSWFKDLANAFQSLIDVVRSMSW